MSDNSKIEWTDATWNPVAGCTKISPGCDNCYAERVAERFRGTPAYPNGFDLTLHPERLEQPLKWKRPRRIFVNSMSDLFHKDVPDAFIDKIFAVMALAQGHTFQILTKRSSIMRDYFTVGAWVRVLNEIEEMRLSSLFNGSKYTAYQYLKNCRSLPNVWLGVSVEGAQQKSRIKNLQETPAAVRFLSIEPLIAPIGELDLTGINWVIVGGESGTGARPMHPEWAREVRDQCVNAGVPFFFKQWGEWGVDSFNGSDNAKACWLSPDGTALNDVGQVYESACVKPCRLMFRDGKRKTGRELDGREWNEYPAEAA